MEDRMLSQFLCVLLPSFLQTHGSGLNVTDLPVHVAPPGILQ